MIDPKVVVDEFKTEYMKMTHEERLDYLNRMGFVFEEVIPMIPSEHMSFDEFETKLDKLEIKMDAYPPTIYPPTTFDIFKWKFFQAWFDYLEMMEISSEEADIDEIFEQFKTKFDNMTEEECFDYLDKMGFIFSKRKLTISDMKLAAFTAMSYQICLDYLKNLGIFPSETDVEENTQEDIYDGIFEQFKTKFDNMTHEERLDYLDRMGFVFSKKEQTDEPTKLISDDCALSRIKKEK